MADGSLEDEPSHVGAAIPGAEPSGTGAAVGFGAAQADYGSTEGIASRASGAACADTSRTTSASTTAARAPL